MVWQRFERDKPKLLTEQYDALEHDPAFQGEERESRKAKPGHLEVTKTFERSEKYQIIGPLGGRFAVYGGRICG